ncbi:MAG: CobW family GTP-binding protein, partial [Cyanobium sp.]
KCDLVEEPRVQQLEQQLREIKSEARILRAVKGEVPLPLLLSVGLFESDKVVSQQNHDACDHDHGVCVHEEGHSHGGHGHGHATSDEHSHAHNSHDHSDCDHEHGHCEHDHAHSHGDDHGHDHGHGHHHHDHSHDHGAHPDHQAIEGFTSLSFASDGPFALRKFQNFLDNQMPQGVFRAKGILWFNESERRHIFHLAGKRFSIDDSDWPGPRKNQLVLIGKGLDHSTLRRQLQACVAKDAGKGFG